MERQENGKMIRTFSVKNYKNFRETLTIDFTKVREYHYNAYCVKNDLISKMIVYGKNAVGKSNLGTALQDIVYTTVLSPYGYLRNDKYLYKNANAETKDLVEFQYSLLIDNKVIDYMYAKKNEMTVVAEQFFVDGTLIFAYDTLKGTSDFSNVALVNAGGLDWDGFLDMAVNGEKAENENTGNPTALRYIMYNTVQNEHGIIYQLRQFINGMRFSDSVKISTYGMSSTGKTLLEDENLQKFQDFLNEYGVACDLIALEKPDGEKDIYFDYAKPLHFWGNMSSGTAALTKFYLNYLYGNKPTFVFIDEFDAYYHFELSEKIVDLLETQFDCQVILTTHNTNLLSNSIMRPDCFMILDHGKLTPICDATNRELRQGHNLEKLYKNGEFDA